MVPFSSTKAETKRQPSSIVHFPLQTLHIEEHDRHSLVNNGFPEFIIFNVGTHAWFIPKKSFRVYRHRILCPERRFKIHAVWQESSKSSRHQLIQGGIEALIFLLQSRLIKQHNKLSDQTILESGGTFSHFRGGSSIVFSIRPIQRYASNTDFSLTLLPALSSALQALLSLSRPSRLLLLSFGHRCTLFLICQGHRDCARKTFTEEIHTRDVRGEIHRKWIYIWRRHIHGGYIRWKNTHTEWQNTEMTSPKTRC